MPNDIPGTATTIKRSPPLSIPTSFAHPLDPLTPDEISAVSLAVRHHVAANEAIKAVRFITCYLVPPPKRAVLAYLGIPIEPGKEPEPKVDIVRRAEVDFLDIITGTNYNVYLSLDTAQGIWTVDTLKPLPSGVQPQISVEELIAAERIVKADPTVRRLAAEVGVKPHEIYCDGWSIGFDDRFPQARRVQQGLVFARFSEHDNLYAHPMDFVPIVDANEEKVLHVDFPPRWYKINEEGKKGGLEIPELGVKLSVDKTGPLPPLPNSLDEAVSEAALNGLAGRDRIPPPRKAFDFLPELMVDTEDHVKDKDDTTKPWQQRTDLKPLQILQPQGVSFKMSGHQLEWQGWKMHVAFSHREGTVLSTITYRDYLTGQIHPILYRLSLAEMVVPYGSPESPHPRKFAFDSGEYGMGTMANELSLGCDCLGEIKYLPGTYTSHSGNPVVIENVICIHEEDSGVLWKHTDFRPGGKSKTVRRRRLVVSMVCTLANYEYIWNYQFYQDGSIEIECRLTGILQVYAQDPSEPNVFGTTVAPGVNAQNHQHMFSFRLDPMIDGLSNTLVESDILPLASLNPEYVTGSKVNFAGNAFVSLDKKVDVASPRPYDLEKERRWRIVNPGRKHSASGKEVGYGITGLKGCVTPMMAREDGWALRRAGFTGAPVWVVKEVEGENTVIEEGKDKKGQGEGEERMNKVKGEGSLRMWPAGKYVPQTREAPADSIGKWAKGTDKLDTEKGEDILVFLTLGTTHIPRPEDWPVMPAETMSVHLKPMHFFDRNPAMDVPGTKDEVSRGARMDGAEGQCGCN
ncbi:peroxisomal copper amine oxidase [Stygiomarasmius scandens]|uniref:Amine oxidase n=1 Tax=Marasmiellus scandens TaxID=2682957 RepID=A0ABR1JQK3_9AGAR